ncbi:hypothetical protein LX69_00240 [Breznakibacter xylanolyticus]|uniref:Uncharacterized protein n=1 Tax=Breznakibacter xylanolyticus TaxID=990 RepID=A0A2W7NK64_9BACT|nr:hypothetical protein LX69_00240 [Breznakibacter xylanolyticus]
MHPKHHSMHETPSIGHCHRPIAQKNNPFPTTLTMALENTKKCYPQKDTKTSHDVVA